jgi:hypothetical protein
MRFFYEGAKLNLYLCEKIIKETDQFLCGTLRINSIKTQNPCPNGFRHETWDGLTDTETRHLHTQYRESWRYKARLLIPSCPLINLHVTAVAYDRGKVLPHWQTCMSCVSQSANVTMRYGAQTVRTIVFSTYTHLFLQKNILLGTSTNLIIYLFVYLSIYYLSIYLLFI